MGLAKQAYSKSMPDARFAILDPAAGISGDMLLGALIAAGAPPDWLRAVPQKLGFPEVQIQVETVDRCGVQAVKVNVVLPGGLQEHPAPVVDSDHDHGLAHSDDGANG